MSRSFSRRQAVAVAGTLSLAGLLVGCSTGSTTSSSSSTSSASASVAEGAYPTTITHAYGETTIDKAPTRVVTVGWGDADFVAAYGIVPVAAPKITWGGNDKDSTDWYDAKVAELGGETARYDDADGVPVDEIAKLNPDLILGVNSGMSKAEYDKLSKIAKTVAFPDAAFGTPWETSAKTIGQALGQGDKAEQMVADTKKVLADGAAKHPELEGKSAAWISINAKDLSAIDIYTDLDLRPQMFTEMGMKNAPIVDELSDGKAFSAKLSAEKAADLDSDVVVFYSTSDDETKTFTSDPLLGKIPALADGHYVASMDNASALPMSLPTPLSMPVAVEKFLPKLASAVEGKPAS